MNRLFLTDTVKNIIIITVIMFIAQSFISDFTNKLAFYNIYLPNIGYNPNFEIWQVFTYIFLHGGLMHLILNMYGLAMLGPGLEAFMGPRKFLIFYIACGVGAALFYAGINFYMIQNLSADSPQFYLYATVPSVGASGALFGVLAAFGFLFPNVELSIYLIPIPIKARNFVIIYGLIEVFSGVTFTNSPIAHFAHVGGLVVGLILLRFFNFSKPNR